MALTGTNWYTTWYSHGNNIVLTGFGTRFKNLVSQIKIMVKEINIFLVYYSQIDFNFLTYNFLYYALNNTHFYRKHMVSLVYFPKKFCNLKAMNIEQG